MDVEQIRAALENFTADNKSFSSVLRNAKVLNVWRDGETVYVDFTLPVEAHLCNSYGSFHGGAICTAIDLLSTMAIVVKDRFNRTGVSIDLSCQYLSAAPRGATVFVRNACAKVTKTLAFASTEMRLNDEHGVIVAKGSHTKYLGPSPSL